MGGYMDTYEPAEDGEYNMTTGWSGDFNHLVAESSS